ncbi:hypothetical protein ACFLZZ_01845 [Nanoarchaeota archaeon]
MTETMKQSCSFPRKEIWTWYNIMHDLENQGKVNGVVWRGCGPQGYPFSFDYKGKVLTMTWQKDLFLLLSMEKDSKDFGKVVEGFSKVVEYKPFCKYLDCKNGIFTYEWDKKDSKGRYEELKGQGHKITLLQKLE